MYTAALDQLPFLNRGKSRSFAASLRGATAPAGPQLAPPLVVAVWHKQTNNIYKTNLKFFSRYFFWFLRKLLSSNIHKMDQKVTL